MPMVETIAVITVPDIETPARDRRIEVCREGKRLCLHVKGEGGDTATIYMDRGHALTLVQQIVEATR